MRVSSEGAAGRCAQIGFICPAWRFACTLCLAASFLSFPREAEPQASESEVDPQQFSVNN